ncbi:MAG: flagellar biosynthesis anti-sigma factor FlgM [Desulfobacca sp.]|uniref:flagellar biosynthesis anti-sigma factor FlgM n=1 Tax=Desulfobacca sp. TaxID=2067990 RepID=UPI00404BA169
MKTENKQMPPPATQRQLKILLKALLHLGQTPDVRQEKVKKLSTALRTNGYRIDCRKLADSLITSLLFGLLR